MLAHITGHIYIFNPCESMIQPLPARFVPTLYRMAIGRNVSVPRWNPFHLERDGQELVPPVMDDFGATPRDATWRVKGIIDLARVNGVLKDRGTNEDQAIDACYLCTRPSLKPLL